MSNQDDELRRNQAAYNAPAPTGDATDLHEQAQQALYDRVDEAHAKIVQNATQQLEGETKDAAPDEKHRRKSILKERAEMLLTSMRDKAKAVYEDAARRRGWHQASLDQLQGAVGLPLDAAERQAEVERRLDAHHEAMAPSHALQKAGDGLPAFGIVAAVMGVVKTMASVGQPPPVLGEMIAAALVGTFLGILISYGFVSPLAQLLEQKVDETTKELHCVKATLLASLQGYAPAVAVEFGRKILYSTERPTFVELEKHVKHKR